MVHCCPPLNRDETRSFPPGSILLPPSSPSRVRFAAPKNGAPLTAPGRGKHALRLGRKAKQKEPHPAPRRRSRWWFGLGSPFFHKNFAPGCPRSDDCQRGRPIASPWARFHCTT